jgi:hypothetical protein
VQVSVEEHDQDQQEDGGARPPPGPAGTRARRSHGRSVVLDTARQLVSPRRRTRHYSRPAFWTVSAIIFGI